MQKYFNKLSKNRRGFTIIELIVVVAIIAVLASIVLVNVTGYVNQAKDASVKANLSSLMTDATTRYITDGNYGNACSGLWPSISAAINSAVGASASAFCYNNGNNWCAQSNLKSSGNFCVDSTGRKNNAGGCSGTTYTCT